jgi:hypothetical protein
MPFVVIVVVDTVVLFLVRVIVRTSNFPSFRRSGLQEKLSVAEVTRLADKLHKKTKPGETPAIDYEKYETLLNVLITLYHHFLLFLFFIWLDFVS